MATLASEPLKDIVDGAVNHSGLKSAVSSGIVPDQAHLDSGGYHCSVDDLIRFGNQNDYSNVRPHDKNFNKKYGAAYDIGVNTADMIKVHERVYAVWADRSDPRRKFINAINCWKGFGDATRYDFVANTATWASDDHTWHFHGEVPREYVLLDKAARAHISIYKGESKATWIANEEEDDMNTADLNKALRDPKDPLAGVSKAIPWQYAGGGIPDGMSTLSVLNATYEYSKATAALIKVVAARDEVDETKLGGEIGRTLAPAVTALITPILADMASKAGGLTPEQVGSVVEQAVRAVLREGVGNS